MRIVISGVGDVGFHLARQLSQENHHITVIDPDESKLERADAACQVLTISGSSTSLNNLRDAEVGEADLLLAVSSSEEVNITTCILAKKMGARKTLARVSNAEYVAEDAIINFAELGVDHMIYPEDLAAQEIVKLIERAAATDIHDFENGRLTVIGLRLEDTAPVVRRTIQEISQELGSDIDFRIVLINRGGKTTIPSYDMELRAGDQIILMTKPEGLKTVLKLAGKEKTKFSNIMILGGGKIGRACALLMQHKFNVKLLELDSDKSMELADKLDHTLVINGDGRDMELLDEESIKDMDAYIAVTEDAETNIISSLMAREMGVKKTITYVENAEYTQLTQAIGIDSLINKKLIAANVITRYVHHTEIISLSQIHGMDAEVMEFVVPPDSLVTRAPVRELKFPRGGILGGVVRGSEAFIAVGDTRIMAQDRVVVFVLPGCIKAVEEFFT